MSSTSASTDPVTERREPSNVPPHEVARANLYHMVARAFSSPLEMEEEHPQQLRDIVPELPGDLREVTLSLADAWENALQDREPLALAYARHFLGPFEILTPPYASFYLEPDQRLMGNVSQLVARFYVEAGLGPGHGPHEAPDHVALEWEFMYFLTYQYVISGDKRWLEQRNTFRSTHLDHWMPSLAAAMAETAEHPFYRALAALVHLLVPGAGRNSE